MRTHLLFAALVVAFTCVGCSHASATLRGRHTAADVSVYGAEGAIATGYMAASYEQTASYAQAYADCQAAGTCWQSLGGLGSDLELNYSRTGVVGGQSARQPASQAPANGAAASGGSSEDPCAREMAADALRGVRSLDRNEDVELKGSPSCEKGGVQ